MHEVGREQGVLPISAVFSTVREVGREQGVLPISVVFSTVREVGRARSTYCTNPVDYSLLCTHRNKN